MGEHAGMLTPGDSAMPHESPRAASGGRAHSHEQPEPESYSERLGLWRRIGAVVRTLGHHALWGREEIVQATSPVQYDVSGQHLIITDGQWRPNPRL